MSGEWEAMQYAKQQMDNVWNELQDKSNLSIRPELTTLSKASVNKKPELFVDYCRKVIKEVNDRQISLEDAGYQIAGTMFVNELNSPLFEEIVAIAGRSELPSSVLGVKDPNEEWQHLITLVDQYENQLKNTSR